METKSILVVDDEPSMRMALSESLESCGYEVITANNGDDALNKFQEGLYDLVITDVRMPKKGGMEVLRRIKETSHETPVIVITAYGTVNTAVEAMKEGASDFIMKPFSLEHLELVVKNVVSKNEQDESTSGYTKREHLSSKKTIVTRDDRMLSLLDLLKGIARSNSSVLIQGESGTGKELIARYIHHCSDRSRMPFVAVNCSAIPHNLLESEMFGYEKGAFTGAAIKRLGKFELAHGGTLLLDEISEMDLQLQAKLLRVIQESEVDRLGGKGPVPVDVRIIATTNADLKKRVSEKKFRDDLYYRLNVIPVKIPPLRERRDDIGVLTDYFLKKFNKRNGRKNCKVSKDVKVILEEHDWPGNVRELENVIERSVLICRDDIILPEHLYMDGDCGNTEHTENTHQIAGGEQADTSQGLTLRDYEKGLIFDTLEKVGGNKTRASKILGISVRTMRNKLNEYKNDESMIDNR
ncbi:MAG: sigma-54-dependent Fis family transcriptional regulator [Deltaproteobacteria bacterium]|nr:sigma-54-dependent Fis family transcriptional regulator [Deltaproteobacteria bacterium]